MQFLLILLYVVGAILALFLLTALLVKKDFSVQKEVLINRPRQIVFDYVKLIRNQEQYSVWVMRDPNIKIVYTGADGTPGFKSSWESDDKNVGVGEQEIIKMQDGESIEVELRFKKPFEATNWARTRFETVADGQTRVSQELYGRTKFPMNVMNLMMDKLVGKDMSQNFENLKKKLES